MKLAHPWRIGRSPGGIPGSGGAQSRQVLCPPNGGGGHFDNLGLALRPAHYREHGNEAQLREDFDSSRSYSSAIVEYIDTNRKDDRPWFAYLAHTASHWPRQAPASSTAKYGEVYPAGYDKMLAARLMQVR